ncbi:MAG: hypothetical protein GKS02_03955 [Alphaproteobacteria bacterium]|nr:hypothetical protein [Alphaproteobacteria bacterium]
MKRFLAPLILAVLVAAGWQVFSPDPLRAQQAVPEPVGVDQGVAASSGATPGGIDAAGGEPAGVEQGVADPSAEGIELTDDEIRELLSKNSIDGFTNHWKRRRGYLNSKECGDYHRLDGPTVYCEASEVPDELVQEYRAEQIHLNSTFLSEPQVKF